MSDFALTADVILKPPSNLRNIAAEIQQGLNGVKATVNIGINQNVVTNVNNLKAGITSLDSSLQSLNVTAKTTSDLFRGLAGSFKTVANVSRTVKEAGTAADTAKKGFSGLSGEIEKTAARFSAFVVVSQAFNKVFNSIGESIGEALKYQNELVRLSQVGNDSAETINRIGKEALTLGIAFGASSSDLVKGASTLRQAGLSAKDVEKSLRALAKASLSPSFTDSTNTVEGLIAAMGQFNITADQFESTLGSIAAVSNKYAVESNDLVTAIRTSGAAFKQAGGNLNELIGLFTAIRQSTREAPESIAVGLKTIAGNFQKDETVQKLKSIGVEVRDVQGNFVGLLEAFNRLQAGLSQFDPKSQQYFDIAEQIGGIRQIGKLLPGITNFKTALEAVNTAKKGANSLDLTTIQAQDSLVVKLSKVREEFGALFKQLTDNTGMKLFLDLTLQLASGLTKLAKSLEPVLPALVLLGGLKLGNAVFRTVKGVSGSLLSRNSGGSIPGNGNTDTVPAMLTPGEYVNDKNTVKFYGTDFFRKLKSRRIARGFNSGGQVGDERMFYAEGGEVPDIVEMIRKILKDDFLKELKKPSQLKLPAPIDRNPPLPVSFNEADPARDFFSQQPRRSRVPLTSRLVDPLITEDEALPRRDRFSTNAAQFDREEARRRNRNNGLPPVSSIRESQRINGGIPLGDFTSGDTAIPLEDLTRARFDAVRARGRRFEPQRINGAIPLGGSTNNGAIPLEDLTRNRFNRVQQRTNEDINDNFFSQRSRTRKFNPVVDIPQTESPDLDLIDNIRRRKSIANPLFDPKFAKATAGLAGQDTANEFSTFKTGTQDLFSDKNSSDLKKRAKVIDDITELLQKHAKDNKKGKYDINDLQKAATKYVNEDHTVITNAAGKVTNVSGGFKPDILNGFKSTSEPLINKAPGFIEKHFPSFSKPFKSSAENDPEFIGPQNKPKGGKVGEFVRNNKTALAFGAATLAPVINDQLFGSPTEKGLLGTNGNKTATGIAGGLSGAATGAALGSTFGPVGTAVGGVVGGLVGLVNSLDDFQKKVDSVKLDTLTQNLDKELEGFFKGKNVDKTKLTFGQQSAITNASDEALSQINKNRGPLEKRVITSANDSKGILEFNGKSFDQQNLEIDQNKKNLAPINQANTQVLDQLIANGKFKSSEDLEKFFRNDKVGQSIIGVNREVNAKAIDVSNLPENQKAGQFKLQTDLQNATSDKNLLAEKGKDIAAAQTILKTIKSINDTNFAFARTVVSLDKFSQTTERAAEQLAKGFDSLSFGASANTGQGGNIPLRLGVSTLGAEGRNLNALAGQGGEIERAKTQLPNILEEAFKAFDNKAPKDIRGIGEFVNGATAGKGLGAETQNQLENLFKDPGKAKDLKAEFEAGGIEAVQKKFTERLDKFSEVFEKKKSELDKISSEFINGLEGIAKFNSQILQERDTGANLSQQGDRERVRQSLNRPIFQNQEIDFSKPVRQSDIRRSQNGLQFRNNQNEGKIDTDLLSIAQLNRGFSAQQTGLTGLTGGKELNANAIGAELQRNKEGLKAAQDKVAANQDKDPGLALQGAKEVSGFQQQIANNISALKNLQDTSKSLAAAQEKLARVEQQIEGDKKSRLSFAENLINASPGERFKIQQNANLASGAIAQGSLTGFNDKEKQGILSFLNQAGETRLQFQNNGKTEFDTASNLKTRLLQNSGLVGQNPNDPIFADEKKARAAINGGNAQAQDATNILIANLQGENTKFLTGLDGIMKKYFDASGQSTSVAPTAQTLNVTNPGKTDGLRQRRGLGNIPPAVPKSTTDLGGFTEAIPALSGFTGAASVLAAALDKVSIPSEIKTTVNGTYNINLNGAEIMAALPKVVAEQVSIQIAEFFYNKSQENVGV